MKKAISLFAAFAMVLTLFASVAFAEIPASATLHLDINTADEDQTEMYLDEIGEIPEGYTLYVVSISQSGLGAFTNTNTKTTSAQLKKPTGFLKICMTFKIYFDAENFANIYADEDYVLVVGNAFSFASSYSGAARTISAYTETFNNGGTVDYALNAKGQTSIAENETIVDLYILANAPTTGTLDSGTLFNMADMEAGSNKDISGGNVTSNQAKYSIGNGYLTCSDSFVLGSSGGGGSEPEDEIKEADTGYELESKYVESAALDLTDLQGHDVTLSKNYGIAKFTENIDTVAKNYFLHVVDDKEESADLPINFAEQGFDFESANVSFFAIVRSATHKVVSMTLKAVAKSE
jgi:hypothetical protein